MPTPLDIGMLKSFSGVFPFLLILVLLYAILIKTEWFREKQGIAAVIAVLAAFMTLVSPIAIKTINLMAPWFVLFAIFLILFMLAFMMFGYEMKDITKFLTEGEFGVGTWVMAIMIIIGVGSLVAVINEEKGFTSLTEGKNVTYAGAKPVEVEFGFWQTLFHPKMLGMALVLLIAMFAIKCISKNE